MTLTDDECDAIRLAMYADFTEDGTRVNLHRALIRAGAAAAVPREPVAWIVHNMNNGERWLTFDNNDHLRAPWYVTPLYALDAAPRAEPPKAEQREPVACWWTRDDDSDTWATGCGNLFTINDSDTPSDTGMKFCLYCGKPVDDTR
jgi:hypothetical protein